MRKILKDDAKDRLLDFLLNPNDEQIVMGSESQVDTQKNSVLPVSLKTILFLKPTTLVIHLVPS